MSIQNCIEALRQMGYRVQIICNKNNWLAYYQVTDGLEENKLESPELLIEFCQAQLKERNSYYGYPSMQVTKY